MHKIKIDGTSANAFEVGDRATDKVVLKNTAGVASIVSLANAAALSADSLVDGTTNHAFLATDDTKLGKIDVGGSYTVGAAGDYATLTAFFAAFEIFQGTTVTLLEDITEAVTVQGGASGVLKIVGDPRETIPGLHYLQGYASPNTTYGNGVVTLSNSGNDLVVSCVTTDPDFAAAGLVAGDKLSVMDDSGARTVETVNSVIGKTITLTGIAPTVGGADSSVTILPNRIWQYGGTALSLTSDHFEAMSISGVRYIKTGTGAGTSISIARQSHIEIKYCVLETESTAASSSSTLLSALSTKYVRFLQVAFLELDYFGLSLTRTLLIDYSRCFFTTSKTAQARPVNAAYSSSLQSAGGNRFSKGFLAVANRDGLFLGAASDVIQGFSTTGLQMGGGGFTTLSAGFTINAVATGLNGVSDGVFAGAATITNCTTAGISLRKNATAPGTWTMSGNTKDYDRQLSEAYESFVFNEDGIDADFRVESDGNANALQIDGALNAVGIMMAATSAAAFDVAGISRATTLCADGDSGGTASTNSLSGATDTPTEDPGWAESSTVNMAAPDGYLKAYVGTQAVVIPYWNT